VTRIGAGAQIRQRLRPSDEPPEEGNRQRPGGQLSAAGQDLHYTVELWDQPKQAVEQVLAVTVSASIGFAAYFAATREYPQRCITLRHRHTVLSRWNGATH